MKLRDEGNGLAWMWGLPVVAVLLVILVKTISADNWQCEADTCTATYWDDHGKHTLEFRRGDVIADGYGLHPDRPGTDWKKVGMPLPPFVCMVGL